MNKKVKFNIVPILIFLSFLPVSIYAGQNYEVIEKTISKRSIVRDGNWNISNSSVGGPFGLTEKMTPHDVEKVLGVNLKIEPRKGSEGFFDSRILIKEPGLGVMFGSISFWKNPNKKGSKMGLIFIQVDFAGFKDKKSANKLGNSIWMEYGNLKEKKDFNRAFPERFKHKDMKFWLFTRGLTDRTKSYTTWSLFYQCQYNWWLREM